MSLEESRVAKRTQIVEKKKKTIKDSDIFVYPVYGDRFDTMAQRYYENSNLWWIIAKANEISDGRIAPDPLVKLRIPTEIEDILQSISEAN